MKMLEENKKPASTEKSGKIALILGGLTLLLFSAKPYILELIEPAKSIGRLVGENAKDLLDSVTGGDRYKRPRTTRDIWSNIITILAFASLIMAIVYSSMSIQNETKKWYGIAGAVLCVVGVGIYLSHLAIGLIGILVIGLLAVVLVGGIS